MATNEQAALRLAHPTVVPEPSDEDDEDSVDGPHLTVRPEE